MGEPTATDSGGSIRLRVRLSKPQMAAIIRLIEDDDPEPGDEAILAECSKILRHARKKL